MITDLSDFSQLEEGKLKVESRPVPVKELLDEMLDTLKPLAVQKDVRLVGEASEELLVCCDRDRTLQILSNLVGNGIKIHTK